MTAIIDWLGRNVTRFVVLTAFLSSLFLAGAVLAERFGYLPNYLCDIGFAELSGAQCVESKVQKMRREMEIERREMVKRHRVLKARMREEKRRAVADVEAKRKEAEAFILDVRPEVTKTSSPSGLGGYVAVSSSFAHQGGSKKLLGALCFLAKDTGGPDPRTPLARMSSDGSILNATDGSLDSHDAARARAVCPWPSVS